MAAAAAAGGSGDVGSGGIGSGNVGGRGSASGYVGGSGRGGGGGEDSKRRTMRPSSPFSCLEALAKESI